MKGALDSAPKAWLTTGMFRLSPTVFAAKTEGEDLVLDVFDIIGADWFGEGITAKSVARTLASSKNTKRIVVRVNSPGGSTTEGTTIYNLLRAEARDGKKIRVEILGLAASMASIVALAGDEVAMAEGALYMIHNPWLFAMGDSADLKKSAQLLDTIKASMLDIYESRSNTERAVISKMMDDETWMTPIDALRAGFVDEVISDNAEARGDGERTFAVLSKFNKTPAQLLERFKSDGGQQLVAAIARGDFKPKTKENNMDPRILALLGLTEGATADDVVAALETRGKPSAASLEDLVPRADFDNMKARVAKLEAEKAASEAAAVAKAKTDFEAKVDATLDKRCEEGRIAPAAKAYHRNMILASDDMSQRDKALAAFESFAATLPELVGNKQTAAKVREEGDGTSAVATDDDVEMANLLGIPVESFAEGRAAIKKDPKNYNPNAYRFIDA